MDIGGSGNPIFVLIPTCINAVDLFSSNLLSSELV